MNSEASQLRDQDLVKWIENKLGDPSELWAGRQASSLLTKAMITELETCFQGLEPHVKLKIIQAILHLSPKLVQMWREPLMNLLNLARRDADDWVEVVADMFRDFPVKGCLCSTPSNSDSYFYKTLEELQRIFREKVDNINSSRTLPPCCDVLSLSVIKGKFGYSEIEQKRHFLVSNTTKSLQLLEEVKKASELQNSPMHRKNNGIISSFPIKMRSTLRKPNEDLPMKGIPSVNTFKLSCGFTNEPKKFQRQLAKREGGAMLIDIAELPQFSGGKRRKSITDSLTITVKSKISNIEDSTPVPVTSASNSGPPKKGRKRKNEISEVKDFAIPVQESKLKPLKNIDDLGINNRQNVAQENLPKTCSSASSSSFTSPINFVPSSKGQESNISDESQNLKGLYSQPKQNLPFKVPSYSAFEPDYSLGLNSKEDEFKNYEKAAPVYPQYSFASNLDTSDNFTNLSTKNEVNLSAQKQVEELLKEANKLTPVSRNLITAFLNGNRTNPFQGKLGSIVTLPLSQTIDTEQSYIGDTQITHLVQTFFQMDYQTGEWKRLRKSRILTPDEEVEYQSIATNSSSQPKTTNFLNDGLIPDLSSTTALNLTPAELAFPSHFDFH